MREIFSYSTKKPGISPGFFVSERSRKLVLSHRDHCMRLVACNLSTEQLFCLLEAAISRVQPARRFAIGRASGRSSSMLGEQCVSLTCSRAGRFRVAVQPQRPGIANLVRQSRLPPKPGTLFTCLGECSKLEDKVLCIAYFCRLF